jgi:tetratricopeptide (TPR) repeat protein
MQTPNPTQSFSLQGASQQEACRWVKLGNAERSKNEIGKAIDCYRKAVALNSSYLDPLQKIEGGYKLAATLLHRKSEGDLQESLQLFQGITQASKYLESAHPKLLQKILANYVFALTQRGTQRTRGCSFAKRWRA